MWQIEQDNLIEKKRNSSDSWQKAQRGTVATLLAEMDYLDTSDEPIRAMGMGLGLQRAGPQNGRVGTYSTMRSVVFRDSS